MRAQIVIPVIASILILGTLVLSQDAEAQPIVHLPDDNLLEKLEIWLTPRNFQVETAP